MSADVPDLLPLSAVLRPAVTDARRAIEAYVGALSRALDSIELERTKANARPHWLQALADLSTETQILRDSLNRISAAAGLPASGYGRLLAYLQLHLGEPIVAKNSEPWRASVNGLAASGSCARPATGSGAMRPRMPWMLATTNSSPILLTPANKISGRTLAK